MINTAYLRSQMILSPHTLECYELCYDNMNIRPYAYTISIAISADKEIFLYAVVIKRLFSTISIYPSEH